MYVGLGLYPSRHEYPPVIMWALLTWYGPNGHMVRKNGHMVPTEIIVWGYVQVRKSMVNMWSNTRILVVRTTNALTTQVKSQNRHTHSRAQRMEGMREGVDFQEVKRQSITVQLIKIHQCQPIILGVISLTHNVLENSPSNSVYSCILNDSSEKTNNWRSFGKAWNKLWRQLSHNTDWCWF